MDARTVARYLALIGIASLPLTVITPAHAINKHETGGKSTQSQCQFHQTATPARLGHPPESP